MDPPVRPEPLPGERPGAQRAVDRPLTRPHALGDLPDLQPAIIHRHGSGSCRQPIGTLANQVLDAAKERLGEQSQDIGSRLVASAACRLRAWHLCLKGGGPTYPPNAAEPTSASIPGASLAGKRRLGEGQRFLLHIEVDAMALS